MKGIKKFFVVLMCVSCVATPVNAQIITKPQTTTNVQTATKPSVKQPSALAVNKARKGITNWKKPPKKGWYTLKNGKKRYYRKSKYIKGLQKLGSYRYFFSMKNGVMATQDTTYKKITYFIDDKGHVTAWKKGNTYYNQNGKRMNRDEREIFRAERHAKEVIQQVTNDKMTMAEKRLACFKWVMNDKQYRNYRKFSDGGDAWYAVNANDYFERSSGNCLSSASSFAYLAKELGYKNVYICAAGPRTVNSSHVWTEIEGLVYDPLFAHTRWFNLYYRVGYETYDCKPYLRVKLS